MGAPKINEHDFNAKGIEPGDSVTWDGKQWVVDRIRTDYDSDGTPRVTVDISDNRYGFAPLRRSVDGVSLIDMYKHTPKKIDEPEVKVRRGLG